jgi:hypothetical protein
MRYELFFRMVSSRIFRNRWAAMVWAGGILWTAYDVAGAAPSRPARGDNAQEAQLDATGLAVDAHDLAVLANAVN